MFKVREKSLTKSRILSTYSSVKAKQTPSALAGWVIESSRVSYQMDLEVSLFCQPTRKRSFAFFLQWPVTQIFYINTHQKKRAGARIIFSMWCLESLIPPHSSLTCWNFQQALEAVTEYRAPARIATYEAWTRALGGGFSNQALLLQEAGKESRCAAHSIMHVTRRSLCGCRAQPLCCHHSAALLLT